MIIPHFGVLINIAYNLNSFDQTDFDNLGGSYYTINQRYSIWQYMGGVFANFKTNKKSMLWVQVMAGSINANFPSFTYTNVITNNNGNVTGTITTKVSLANANAFTYSAGIGSEKDITQSISFLLMLTYTGAKLSYPSIAYSEVGTPTLYTQHTPITMSYGDADVTFGLLFHF